MRLLFLSNLYPPYDIGGYEQLCKEIAELLVQRGHEVHVLTSQHGLNGRYTPEDGVTRSLFLQADLDHYSIIRDFSGRTRREAWNEQELYRVLYRTEPDLVVVWGMWNLSRNLPYQLEQWVPDRLAYYISSYWPMDLDVHEEYWRQQAGRSVTEFFKAPLRGYALWRLRREGYPPKLHLRNAVCCSKYVRDRLVEAGALRPGIRVLYNGINPEPFLAQSRNSQPLAEGKLRLLYFGSLFPHKGVHTAVEAAAILKERGWVHDFELTILGDGHPDYVSYLHQLCADKELGSLVHFAGRIPRLEIPAALSQFDVFLFTSLWPEPMARTVMEAMATGMLVIGTEVGGQTEMLGHDENSLTFTPGEAAELADRIEKVLLEPSLGSTLANAGRDLVLREFTTNRMVDEVESWLQSIIDG